MARPFVLKLGKRRPKLEPGRRLMLGKYLTPALPPPPPSLNWADGVTNFGMMLNDSLGDCTIAGCGHAIQIASLNSDNEITVADSDILAAYEAWCGYDPNNPDSDQGGVEVDVLNNWRKSGLAGHTLTAYADPSPGDPMHVKQAVMLFGGVYIGLGLPLTAQNQDIWDVVPDAGDGSDAPYSWGGHCVYCVGYDANYITCITWSQLLKMTWAFWAKYCDESHALLMGDAKPPAGVDVATWQADLAAVTG